MRTQMKWPEMYLTVRHVNNFNVRRRVVMIDDVDLQVRLVRDDVWKNKKTLRMGYVYQ